MALWQKGMSYLSQCNVGLDGVVDQQENYMKSGFKLVYGNVRYQGVAGGSMTSEHVVSVSDVPFDVLSNYDRRYFPADRSRFLKQWISAPGASGLAFVQDDGLLGYGVIRACREGYKIGPLFADSDAIAETLFNALKSKLTEQDSIFLDVPEVNAFAMTMAEKYSMVEVFRTARMYTRDAPNISLERVYGVTSFELG